MWIAAIVGMLIGFAPLVFSDTAPGTFRILLVDDFSTSEFPWTDWWKSALPEFTLAAVDQVDATGRLGPIRLEGYDLVIWNTGTDTTGTLTAPDRAALAAYLENGGRLFLTGTCIAEELAKSDQRPWLKRYLRCDFLMPNSPVIEGSVYEWETLEGIKQTPFEGLAFEIDHGQFDTYPAHNLNLIYEAVDATAGGGGASHCVRFADLVGNLGVCFEGPILPAAPPCRILFLTFPLETVHPPEVRREMLTRALAFFRQPDKPVREIRGTIHAETQSGPPLEGVEVRVPGTPWRTLTRADGSYVVPGLTETRYRLTASLFGYHARETSPLTVPETSFSEQSLVLNPRTSPLSEGRGVWIVRDQMTSPESIRKVVDDCEKAGFNALFVQVRGRGDAYYKSATEPRADALADQPEDFDPLALAIELGHEKGMQVHAWLNAMYSWGLGPKPESPKHILNRHPEWVLMNRAGKRLSEYTREELREHRAEGSFLSACIPACREYLADVYLEVVNNYDVDGIHFDFIRFPFASNRVDDPWDLGYSPLSRAAFKEEHGFDPLDIDPEDREKVEIWNDWRREGVGRLVGEVTRRAHAAKPGIRVSAAVLNRYHLARGAHCFQDWIVWMQKGLLDTCCIMAYDTDNDIVANRIRMAVENQGPATVWAGLAANWRGNRTGGAFESILDRVELVRRQNPEGIMFFAYKHFDDEELQRLKDEAFAIPAVVPPVRTSATGPQ